MYWQEDDTQNSFQVPDDIVDVLFSVQCKRLPVDHAYALSAALQEAVPWAADSDSGVAIHSVHVAGSQNGWERPEHSTGQFLILSRRTKLRIRVPKDRMDGLMEDLSGKTLDISGCPMSVGSGKIRPLSTETTLFARHVVGPAEDTVQPGASVQEEDDFLDWAVRTLRHQEIRVRKALCGKTIPLAIPGSVLRTRSLLLADLTREESVRLQQQGLGPHPEMGCGIFIPHKGIDAIRKTP